MLTLALILAQTAVSSTVSLDVTVSADNKTAQLTLRDATLPTGDTVTVSPTWTPHRVFDTDHKKWSGFEEMVREIATADVVFFGEQHDDPGTHSLQRALLESLALRRPKVILSLEMFERDVQPIVDGYLTRAISEDSLKAAARPWPRYQTDYRPAVEWARANGWPVIAANVPRPIARAASGSGMAALDSVPAAERNWFARELICPVSDNDYFEKFSETMAAHVPGDTEAEKRTALENYYLAQCIKDETMAESIVQAHQASMDKAIVVHLNGAFHSNYALGTAERVRRRSSSLKIVVISAIPVDNLDEARPSGDDRKLGDWLIYTLKPATTETQ